MRVTTRLAALALGAAFLPVTPSGADAVVGQPAPDFTLPAAGGGAQSLSALKGKWVVLEWVNHDCPFVRKHYGSGNMQKLQSAWTAKGVAWFSVNSSPPGKQGHLTAEQAKTLTAEKKAAPTAVLLDPDGKVGHLYGAKTTPHMFVISPKGDLVYAGAIDDKASTDQADIVGARNYVQAALEEAMGGKPVTMAATQSYGCSVKYQ